MNRQNWRLEFGEPLHWGFEAAMRAAAGGSLEEKQIPTGGDAEAACALPHILLTRHIPYLLSFGELTPPSD